MMDLATLQMLADYHYWANDRLLAVVDGLSPEQFSRDLGSSFPSLQATLAHMMNAEALWMSRILGETAAGVKPEDVPTPAAVRTRWSDLEQQMRRLLAELDGATLDRTVVSRMSDGRQFTQPLEVALHTVFNHGTYHRGQVTTMLRQVGATSAGTDLVLYYRVKSGQMG